MSVVQFYPLPCVVSLVVRHRFVEPTRWVQFPYGTPLQNRLTGRSAPFEGVRLGSNPSSGTCPCGEMVDTVDSKSTAEMRVGSNPTGGT